MLSKFVLRTCCSLNYRCIIAPRIRPIYQGRRFNHTDQNVIIDEAQTLSGATNNVDIVDDTKLLSEIPDAPSALSTLDYESHMRVLQDTLAHFDLDSYSPAGAVRMGLYWLHGVTGLPWWEVIGIGVVLGRLCLFPVTISNMRHMGKLAEHKPELTKLTTEMNEARRIGDTTTVQLAQYQLMKLQKKHNISPIFAFRNMIPQAIYFMSYFIAVKRMASAPLESFKSEGFLWFVDLSATDPTWLLSIFCATTIAATLKTGVEVSVDSMSHYARNAMLVVVPAVVLFSTHAFPTAVVIYWSTSNVVSLIFAILFRIPAVRRVCKVPALPKRIKTVEAVDEKPKGKLSFVTEMYPRFMKWKTKKLDPTTTEADLKKRDRTNFAKAGRAPVVATYPFNPVEKYPRAFQKVGFLSRWKNNFKKMFRYSGS